MKVLITGVTSFIGRAVAREMISEGMEVCGIVRPGSKNCDGLNQKIHILECDMDSIEKLEDMTDELSDIYACVHLAWEGAGKEKRMDESIQEKNKNNTYRLIRALGKLGCERFVFAGSQAEYGVTLEKIKEGMCADECVDEEYPCRPVSEYGKAKLAVLKEAAELCRKYDMTYVHLRIFSVYGKGDHKNTLVSSAVENFLNDDTMVLSSCEQKWNFINIKDCAKAITDTVTSVFTVSEDAECTEHVINIASQDTRPLRLFVEEIRDICGGGECLFGKILPREEGTAYLNPSVEKLIKITGFKQQVSFEEGVREILKP